MDFLSWVGVVGISFFGLFLAWTFLNVYRRTIVQQFLQQAGAGALAPTDPYIQALRTGDPRKLAEAPLPALFSEELLLAGLLKIQGQPSLVDQFIDRICHQFTFHQYEKLVSTWTRYYESLGKGVAVQTNFMRQMSERLNIRLEHERSRATLEADIAEQDLRAGRAAQRLKEVNNPREPREEEGAEAEIRATFSQLNKDDALERAKTAWTTARVAEGMAVEEAEERWNEALSAVRRRERT